ncbi:[protein-PII] uridylyltransferase [Halotalea alkalilenta]|uniref:Bifunctional uridylyltransferase/uridylyl-removing enzyme n=1 Tax=Halotalea alkalilenta TaxID=376489 RepID=A0A172YCV7_9GAMM|nr:[protein-PII] uridylyltransferase [Halotalea alkalilenta]ANF56932.1 bifunctional uridylyltransferase/uridylyl-removing protein [Halotalea alkalilenta]
MLLHHYRFRPDPSLLDEAGLRARLAALDAERGSTCTTAGHIAAFKQALRDMSSTLDARFHQGEDIRNLIHGRAWGMDRILTLAWERIRWPQSLEGIALLAVGGYGRGELHPHSDIDLLFLLGDPDDTPYREPLSQLITLLWDIGLEIGHSVRTVAECVDEARSDITVITNLLETRTLIGPERLRDEMRRLTAPDKMWPSDAFFAGKWQEQITRHRKFNNSEYSLEPNLKSSPGGLRDLQMIGWVAKRHFGARLIEEIVERGFMTDSDLRIYSQGQAFLWQLRYALHELTHRAEDRLLFDHQKTIAAMLGYRDQPDSLAIEQLMRRYYRVVTTMAELNDMLLQHFSECILQADQPPEIRVLNNRFEVYARHIQARHPNVFKRRPGALLELFVLMAQHPEIEGVRAETIRLIREHRHLIDDAFREDVRHQSLFMELLRSGGDVARQLALMARYGVLGKYLPEFGRIIGLMQYDLFHIYTVDAHTLRVLDRMQSFRGRAAQRDFPLAYELARHLPKLEILWIAGLFHDLGKGRGGDHSQLGAVDARQFCERHGLSRRDTQLVTWLVEHHLLMSQTAQKRDLAEPDVIREFALVVHNEVHLDYLYLLTVADIDATNPTLWNGWRSALLRQLHGEARRALRRGLEQPFDRADWIDDTRQEAYALLRGMNADVAEVEKRWEHFGEDYFLTYSPSDIAWQTLGMIQDPSRPLVLISAPTEEMVDGGTKVFIHTRAVANLFAATVAAFGQLDVSIHDARIVTTLDGWTLNAFILLDANDQPIRDPGRLRHIHDVLVESLIDPDEYPRIASRHTSRQLKHFRVPTRVTLEYDALHQGSVLELIAADRPGLLARVGRIFMEFGISISAAKIATFGERVEDVFFITDANEQPIYDEAFKQRLINQLCEVLDAEV